MKTRYTCTICGWSRVSESIIEFNNHASNEHEEYFYIKDPNSRYRRNRNSTRLRDYVETSTVKSDIKRINKLQGA